MPESPLFSHRQTVDTGGWSQGPEADRHLNPQTEKPAPPSFYDMAPPPPPRLGRAGSQFPTDHSSYHFFLAN